MDQSFLRAGISRAAGPGICRDCYEVDGRTGEPFGKNYRDGRLDIAAEVEERLLSCGVRKESIFSGAECTCHGKSRYFSYRRGDGTSRMMSLVMLP